MGDTECHPTRIHSHTQKKNQERSFFQWRYAWRVGTAPSPTSALFDVEAPYFASFGSRCSRYSSIFGRLRPRSPSRKAEIAQAQRTTDISHCTVRRALRMESIRT